MMIKQYAMPITGVSYEMVRSLQVCKRRTLTRLANVNVTSDPWRSAIIMRTFSILGRVIVRLYQLNVEDFGYVRSAALSINISVMRCKRSLAHLEKMKKYQSILTETVVDCT
jgi:hypothetical protein